MSMVQDWRKAMPIFGESAKAAYKTLRAWCDPWPGAAPGMDTVSRLALRMFYGKTAEQAVVGEYLYRWNLALRSPVFGVPHCLGQ